MATITGSATGGNWSATAAWVGGVVPTAADDVLLISTTGAITIDGTSGSPSLCRSLNCTGYTHVLTHASAKQINIGNSSGGSLTLASGMTYNPGGIIFFVSTTSGNTITSAGKTIGATFNGAGGVWTLQDDFTTPSAGTNSTILLTAGSIVTNGHNITAVGFSSSNSNTRALDLGSGTHTFSGGFGLATTSVWVLTNSTGMTLTQGASTILLNAGGLFTGGGLTYNNVTFTGGGASVADAGNNFTNLSMTGTTNKTGQFIITGNQTVSTTFTCAGNSVINRVLLQSATIGTAVTISASTFTFSNLDLQDITKGGSGSGSIAGITGNSGDCGGNSGWTFTTPATSYWVPTSGTSTGSMSAVTKWASSSGGTGGTGRAPLPQDTSNFDANSISAASAIVTNDMARIGSINWTGVTNNPQWTKNVNCSVYGSITLASGMTNISSNIYTLSGRGSQTLTGAGNTIVNAMALDCATGTYTQQDDWANSNTFTINSGTWAGGAHNLTTAASVAQNGGTFSGIGTLTAAGSLTLAAGTFNNSSASFGTSVTISGGGFTIGSLTAALSMTVNAGTVVFGSGSSSMASFSSSNSNVRSIDLGTGTITLTGTGAVWNFATLTNLTFTGNSSTIVINDTSTTGKTFNGAGLTTYSGIIFSGDNITLNGSNTFTGTFAVNNAGLANGLKIAGGTTQTLTAASNCFTNNGSSGNLTILTIPSAGIATLTAPNQAQISVDFMKIDHSTVTQSNTWYAGNNSTDNGSNTRWIFTAPPGPSTNNGNMFLLF